MEYMQISFDADGNVYINDQDVSKEIRQNEISMVASKVSAFPKVRKHLVRLQQEMACLLYTSARSSDFMDV